jgi:PAS domain S-box-containing protein
MVESVVQSHAEIVVDSTEKSKICVLHVDDEPALLRVTKQCLELEGMFQVDSVSSVEEALAKLEKERYDAVVSDYQMPGKDGLEFLKELRESGNSVPFIMFTGKGREEVAIRALNLGANQYLNKTGETETVYTELAHTITELAKTEKAEELLRLSEERYRNLFENAKDVIILFDLKGNVTSVNKGAEEYGFNRSGMLGKNMLKFIFKRYWPKLLKDVAQIALGKTAEGRIEIHTPKGDKMAEYRSNPIFSDNRVVGIQTILKDTTERKKAEGELRESEERYNVLIESISVAFFAMDKDFRYTDWNKASERLTGIPAKGAIGKSLTEVFPDSKGTKVEQFYQNTLRTNQHQTFVNKYRMGDKDFIFEIDAYPTKDGLSVFARDISERKKAEEALRESEEKYRDLFENAMDAIVTLDLKGSITAVNNSVLRFGYKKEDLVGKNLLDFVSKEYWPAIMRDFSKVAQGEPAKNETELVVPAGKILVEYNAGAMVKENNVAGVQINIRDVTERKKSEELLRESEERFRGLFESIKDPVGIFVGREGRLIDCNAAFKKSSGYTDEELKGKVFLDFVHPGDRAMVLEKYRTDYSEDEFPLVYEIRGVNKKGESIPLELSVSTYKKKGKVIGIEVIHRDLTEHKKAEQALRESGERLRILFENAPDAFYVSDLRGHFIDGNKAAEEMTGYQKDELIGKSFLQLGLLPKKHVPTAAKLLALNALGGSTGPDELVLNRKGGAQIMAEIRTVPTKIGGKAVVLGIARDITERKKNEELVSESQQKFKGLFMGNPEAAAYLDPDSRIRDINPRFEELFGYSLADVQGKHINDVVVPDDRRKEGEALDKEARKGYVYHNTVRRKKDRSLVQVAVSAAPITVGDKVAGIVAMYHDISDLKNAEKRLDVMNEKLRVVGSLTRHDVRNKLTAVNGNAYLIRKRLIDDPDAIENLRSIEAAVRELERIFDFASAYEKLGVEQLAYVDAKKTVDEAAALFPDLKDVKIVNDCGGLTLLADSLLRQLFYNLIDDSLKHGEKLTQIRIHYEKSEDRLKLVYEDDGVGISKDAKPKLFKEGYTTGKGSGYGLYLIKRMMDVYGWTIQETGTPDKGVCFTMVMPEKNQDCRENYQLH